MTLSIVDDVAREAALSYAHNRGSTPLDLPFSYNFDQRYIFPDTFDDAILICQTCRHGGHAAHVLEWFLGVDGSRTHQICPVADCNCRCADEF